MLEPYAPSLFISWPAHPVPYTLLAWAVAQAVLFVYKSMHRRDQPAMLHLSLALMALRMLKELGTYSSALDYVFPVTRHTEASLMIYVGNWLCFIMSIALGMMVVHILDCRGIEQPEYDVPTSEVYLHYYREPDTPPLLVPYFFDAVRSGMRIAAQSKLREVPGLPYLVAASALEFASVLSILNEKHIFKLNMVLGYLLALYLGYSMHESIEEDQSDLMRWLAFYTSTGIAFGGRAIAFQLLCTDIKTMTLRHGLIWAGVAIIGSMFLTTVF